MMAKLMLALVGLSLAPSVLLTGYNTVQGAGMNLEKAGQKVQQEAIEHKRY